ncbi:MAG: efflux RND transporter periplasmic adaptor subunit [Planctomycetota bacterium]
MTDERDESGQSSTRASARTSDRDIGGQDRRSAPGHGRRWIALVFRGVVGLVALLIAVGVVAFAAAVRPEPEKQAIVEQAPLVRTTPVASAPVAREWTGYGTARAMDVAEVAAQVAARVEARPDAIEAGAPVAAGDLIVRLELIDFENRLEAARQLAEATRSELDGWDVENRRIGDQLALLQGELDIERRDYRRYVDALERGAGNTSEAERRQASVKRVEREFTSLAERSEMMPSRRAGVLARLAQQRAEVRLREQELARAEIRAPIGGYLQTVSVEEGELLSVGASVARIVDLSKIEVPLRIPVSAATSVSVGDGVRLSSDGEGSSTASSWEGRIERVAPEADASTRTLTVFVAVEQDPSGDRAAAGGSLLLPGQFVMGRVTAASRVTRLVVPRRAVDEEYVLIARPRDDGVSARAEARRVRVAHAIEGSLPEIDEAETQWLVLEVDSGLEAGDALIVSNLDALRDGSLVRLRAAGEARVRAVSDDAERKGASAGVGGGG